MFHNYFFIKRLSNALNDQLSEWTLLACYSQNKDELIFGFGQADREFYLRASLQPSICLIDFPFQLSKARKNYADLFEELLDKKVIRVSSFAFERSFQIIFEENYALIFKMHGSRSNILLAQNEEVCALFKSRLSVDESLNIADLARDIVPDQPAFNLSNGDPKIFIPALGKEVNAYLKTKGYFELTLDKQWPMMQEVLFQLEHNPIRIYNDGKPALSLLNEDKPVIYESYDPIAAANEFRKLFVYHHFEERGKNREIKLIDEKIQKILQYIEKAVFRQEEITTRRNYSEIANLIMANLYTIPAGSSKVTLHDIYTSKPIEIKLKSNLSPQKNAEQYYRKAKNQIREINQVAENIQKKQEEINDLIKTRQAVIEAEDPKALGKIVGKTSTEAPVHLPYMEYRFEGYEILIGKNAKSNDELTLKRAKKDDLWLHARDVSGSHVIIKNQSGKNTPKNVIERAAEIAAWYSKRKNDSLCPVIYTPKKFIRKRKGDPPGAVVVDREEVTMVVPRGID